MNEKLIDQIKDELVMLSLVQEIKIEYSDDSSVIFVRFGKMPFFHVIEKNGVYSIFQRYSGFPVIETKNAALIMKIIKKMIHTELLDPRIKGVIKL